MLSSKCTYRDILYTHTEIFTLHLINQYKSQISLITYTWFADIVLPISANHQMSYSTCVQLIKCKVHRSLSFWAALLSDHQREPCIHHYKSDGCKVTNGDALLNTSCVRLSFMEKSSNQVIPLQLWTNVNHFFISFILILNVIIQCLPENMRQLWHWNIK